MWGGALRVFCCLLGLVRRADKTKSAPPEWRKTDLPERSPLCSGGSRTEKFGLARAKLNRLSTLLTEGIKRLNPWSAGGITPPEGLGAPSGAHQAAELGQDAVASPAA